MYKNQEWKENLKKKKQKKTEPIGKSNRRKKRNL